MKIFIGADHRGYELMEKVIAYLKKHHIEAIDEGEELRSPDDDFPIFAARVVHAMQSSDEKDPRGILICGSGQGMVMAANRFKGIRAGLGWSKQAAHSIRNDEESNVLALPAELLSDEHNWQDIIDTWLRTPFAGATRYKRRNRELDEL